MIPTEAWRGRMGALTGSLPKEVSTVTSGSGRLAQVYSMPYKNQWNMIAFAGTPCKELLDGQQTWNGWDSRSMAIGPNRTPFFGQTHLRSFFWNWSTIWMSAILHVYIYMHNVLTFGFFLTFGSFVLFMVEAPSALRVVSSMAGAGPVGPRLRWRDEGPVTLCWEMGCLRVLDLFQICKKNTVKEACLLGWPFQSFFRCALLMNKAWLRNHRRFRNRDSETTAQELPFRNYGSCTKVQELWLEKDFQRFRPLRLLLVCGTLKECESCRRHFVRVQHMSFYEHLCNCHYIQSFSPLAWIGMSFC